MERQSKGLTGLEAYCKGGQGPPRAVAPPKKKKNVFSNTVTIHHQQAVTVYAAYGIYRVCVSPKICLHCSAPYNKHALI